MRHRTASVQEAIADVKRGKMLIILDDTREKEADLFIAADAASPAAITAMIRHAGGILCAAITQGQAARLNLPLMVPKGENTESTHVNFTVSVNAARGITTGVSAPDRAKTIRILADPRSREADLVRPGHVFGLIAREGGVLEREGHTEAAVDLARLAGAFPAGVLCEIVGKNGRMAKYAEIRDLARTLKIKIITVRDLVDHVRANPLPPLSDNSGIARVSESLLPTTYGMFNIIVYRSMLDGREHAALVMGKDLDGSIVRVHSQCITGDTFFSQRCDCGGQFEKSMRTIAKNGSGIIVYLSQEGRGIGLSNKIKAYSLQDRGYDTVEANRTLGFAVDGRTYEIAAHILRDLGAHTIRLLTNNPAKERGLSESGIAIAETMPLETEANRHNIRYLRTKKRKLGHRISPRYDGRTR